MAALSRLLLLVGAFAAVGCFLTDSTPGNAPKGARLMWLSQTEIDALPTEGAPFENVVKTANLGLRADLSDQNSQHNNQTFAAALLCARGVNPDYCAQTEQGLRDVVGTERPTVAWPERPR